MHCTLCTIVTISHSCYCICTHCTIVTISHSCYCICTQCTILTISHSCALIVLSLQYLTFTTCVVSTCFTTLLLWLPVSISMVTCFPQNCHSLERLDLEECLLVGGSLYTLTAKVMSPYLTPYINCSLLNSAVT